MFPNMVALQGALVGEKVRTKDSCPRDMAEWCRLEYGRVVRHG